jgi:hypothetical protein
MNAKPETQDRIEVELVPDRSEPRKRQLGGFVRYCVSRLEKELGAREHWKVRVEVGIGVDASTVVVRHGGETIEMFARSHDPVLAIWDAMCGIEERLREQCAVTRAEHP